MGFSSAFKGLMHSWKVGNFTYKYCFVVYKSPSVYSKMSNFCVQYFLLVTLLPVMYKFCVVKYASYTICCACTLAMRRLLKNVEKNIQHLLIMQL
jgi:hypothetical protein